MYNLKISINIFSIYYIIQCTQTFNKKIDFIAFKLAPILKTKPFNSNLKTSKNTNIITTF